MTLHPSSEANIEEEVLTLHESFGLETRFEPLESGPAHRESSVQHTDTLGPFRWLSTNDDCAKHQGDGEHGAGRGSCRDEHFPPLADGV